MPSATSYLLQSFLPTSGSWYKNEETNSDYNGEASLYQNWVSEHYNLHGVKMVYYVTSYDLNENKIFGESRDRSYTRRFDIQAMFELPKEDNTFGLWGIIGADEFVINVSQPAFRQASTYDQTMTSGGIYPEYYPQEKDVLHAPYSNIFYEDISVKHQEAQFLKRQHTFQIHIRPLRVDNFDTTSGSLSADDPINLVNDIDDIFNTSAVVSERFEENQVIPAIIQSPFGSWG